MDCKPTRFLCLGDFLGNNTRVSCHFLLQGIFSTQGWNLLFLYYVWILNHWATREVQEQAVHTTVYLDSNGSWAGHQRRNIAQDSGETNFSCSVKISYQRSWAVRNTILTLPHSVRRAVQMIWALSAQKVAEDSSLCWAISTRHMFYPKCFVDFPPNAMTFSLTFLLLAHCLTSWTLAGPLSSLSMCSKLTLSSSLCD